ncbi:MAG: hypothetical protein GTO02_00625 [Candidatus Dadabacteria bacterium]|nr:hypothetical protein [Candidatus Dadabacteria bacterium]NIQ12951.1 hypothetical protein [Candidatus Dadabacteria bacterium]
MDYFKYLVLAFIVILPIYSYGQGNYNRLNTDRIDFTSNTNHQLSAYYDLRDRQSHIQVTNIDVNNITIHVQIFQHDRNCDELNFFDELTPNDTVVYDMDNIIKNDGNPAPINLQDDSYGYVVVTTTLNAPTSIPPALIGNFRIIDDAGYEYRTNMISPAFGDRVQDDRLFANFNTVDSANQADVIGYAYHGESSTSVRNIDNGFSFDIFVFDLAEEPLSCDRRNFACGNIMNYGINEDYPASRGSDLLCPGGGLANPQGGFVQLINGANLDGTPPESDATENDVFVGLIGINNNDGTGSIDVWYGELFD